MMKLIRETTDLEKLDTFFEDISKNLVIAFGSIFRIAHQYLINWGVEVTSKNKEWIRDQANNSYVKEWKMGSELTNRAIEKAIIKANLEVGNILLNEHVGEIVLSILRRMHNGGDTFKIYDIGAGAGDTTVAILNNLGLYPDTKRIAPYCFFRLIEPSEERLFGKRKRRIDSMDEGRAVDSGNPKRQTDMEEEDEQPAKDKIENHSLFHLLPEQPTYIVGSHNYLRDAQDNSIDIVVSNAVFHHMPFPDHFELIQRKLKINGAMIVGDWHPTIFSHPAFVVPLLEAICKDEVDKKELVAAFKRKFGIEDVDVLDVEKKFQTTEKQKRGQRIFIEFIKALAKELKGVGEALYLLEALESFEDRVANIQNAGLETNPKRVRKNPAFKDIENNQKIIFPDNDLAAVVAATKLRAPRTRKTSPKKSIRRIKT